ncbi:MAG: cysteine--tRNA ligase [bacterium]|nr:cysteine--tRNA ligase [bacterium]
MGWFGTLFKSTSGASAAAPRIFFHNTLSDQKELFVPLKPSEVTMYSCGPTVYGPAHIGNLRSYVFSDTIARVLLTAGFHVRRVINITDVGHLVGDAEEGEDKMAVGAAREKKSPEEIATRYTKLFIEDLDDLNIDTKHILFPRATEYIKEQIALAKTLEEKGFAYRIPDGLYFDTAKFPTYGRLGNRQGANLKEGARVAPVKGKRHPSDFALWRTAKASDLQQWDSPWGRGNPGWHIECSAMNRVLLGIEIDIHTGGEDHVAIHHNNEIAQSEAANGRRFVRYWMHNAFLTMQGEKVSKSLQNDVYLSEIVEKGFHPLALRYFFLQAHYRTPLSFSEVALGAAHEALTRLWRIAREIREEAEGERHPSPIRDRFIAAVHDDLSTPQALGILWETLKSEEYTPEEKWDLIVEADSLLGLALVEPPAPPPPLTTPELPKAVQELMKKREKARKTKDFSAADRIREEIEKSGYRVEDQPEGPVLTRRVS